MDEDYSIYHIPMNLIIDSDKSDRGKLYVGNYQSAEIENLQKNQIYAVVTAAKDFEMNYPEEYSIKRLVLFDADDVEDFNISKYFEQTFQFIDENLKTTNVLVHCFAGCQRSVTIVVAYIIQKQRIEFLPALQYVQERRKIADPNDGFRQQLQIFSEKILSKNTNQVIKCEQQNVKPQLQQNQQQNSKQSNIKQNNNNSQKQTSKQSSTNNSSKQFKKQFKK